MEMVVGLLQHSFPFLGLAALEHGVNLGGGVVLGAGLKVRLWYQLIITVDVVLPRKFSVVACSVS
jgi:hypothetical protein